MKSTFTKEELEIPSGIFVEVADLLLENEIAMHIVSLDPAADSATLEVEYSKGEKGIIREAKDLIAEYGEGNG